MKKIALISLAAIAALVSCQKEEFVNESQAGNSPVFTASIATDETKTTLSDDSPAKILWESTDKITITDGNSHKAVYILSAGAGTKSGTFVYESGTALDASSTYTATYGAAPSAYQVYSSAGSVPLYMTASASNTNDLVFTAQCGVLRVTLTDASHDIMRVEVSDACGNTYRVTSSSAVDIASATKFYIALPAGTYTTLNIYDNNWQMVSKTGISLAVTAGHVKPSVSSSLTFTGCTTKGFKVINSVLRPIVQLWADGPFWSENNIGADTPEAYGQYFAWGYPTGQTPSGTSFSTAFNTDNYPNKSQAEYADMAVANWGADWSVPTKDDFDNLLSKCTASYAAYGSVGATFTGTGAYAQNSIFLPSAGWGYLSNLISQKTSGCYWSNEYQSSTNAYRLSITTESGLIITVGDANKRCGFSVRPVYTPAEPVLLSGEFSVSGTKKVKFTKGNLYWDGSAFHIESSQTAYPTTWSTSHVGHFYWTKTAAASCAETYSDGECTIYDVPFFAESTGGLTVDGQSGLYALSSAEWTYLLSSTSSGGRGDGDSKFKNWVTVNGANCLVIAPDGYSGTIASSYNAAAWAAAEASGLVCLPAAGLRDGSGLSSGGSLGYYWSATPYGINEGNAYFMYFDDSSVEPSDFNSREDRYSVRLVCSVSK